MKKQFSTALSLLLLTMSIVVAGSTVSAQQSSTITIEVGDVFELVGFTPNANIQFTWVLIQDGNFLQATRSEVFQTRLTQPGTYTLSGEIAYPDGTIERKDFTLVVSPRGSTEDPELGGVPVVQTIPPLDANGRFVREEGIDVVTLFPASEEITTYIIDFDTNNDTNGDTFSDNDEDTVNTAFRNGTNPLHVWFLDAPEHVTMRATGIVGEDVRTQTIQVVSTSIADDTTGGPFYPPTGSGASSFSTSAINTDSDFGTITPSYRPNGEVHFSVALRDFTAEDPLLLQWDFGDSTASLLSSPTHRYAQPGSYTVTVEIRDLRSGEILTELSTQVQVEITGTTSSVSSDSESSESSVSSAPQVTPTNPDSNGSVLWLIGKILIAFLIAGIIGGLIAFVIAKLRQGKTLQQTLAEAEESIVGKTAEDQFAEPAPMALSTEPEVVEVEQPSVTHSAMQPSVEELQTDEAQAPDWLKPGIKEAETVEQSPASPPPATLQDAPEAEQPTPAEPMPDWLQPKQEVAPSEPATTEAPVEPVPEQPVEVPPTQTPVPEPEPPTPVQESAPAEEVVTPAPDTTPVVEPIAEPQQPEVTPQYVTSEPAATTTPSEPAETVVPTEVATTTPTQPTVGETVAKQNADSEKEERERERKRRKRQRYRENKRRREQEAQEQGQQSPTVNESPVDKAASLEPPPVEETSTQQEKIHQSGELNPNEPIAYIRADSIEEQLENGTEDATKQE